MKKNEFQGLVTQTVELLEEKECIYLENMLHIMLFGSMTLNNLQLVSRGDGDQIYSVLGYLLQKDPYDPYLVENLHNKRLSLCKQLRKRHSL